MLGIVQPFDRPLAGFGLAETARLRQMQALLACTRRRPDRGLVPAHVRQMPAHARHRSGVATAGQEGVEEVERGGEVARQHPLERIVVRVVILALRDRHELEAVVLVVGRAGVQVLERCGLGVAHEALVVEHVRRSDVVEPADPVQRRDAEQRERMAVAVHVHRCPAAGLRQQPVEGQRAAADQLERGIEQLAQRPPRPVRRPVVSAAVRPVLGQVVSAVERCHAVAVEPAEQVGHGHARHDRLQRGVPGGDRRPLGVAVVGVAPHADITVRPGLLGDPLDRVVAVVDLVHERVHLTARPELAAHVLRQERVAALGEVARDERHPAVAAVLVVGQPYQHGRPRPLAVR